MARSISREMAAKRCFPWSEEQPQVDQEHGLFAAILPQPVVKLFRMDESEASSLHVKMQVKMSSTAAPASTLSIKPEPEADIEQEPEIKQETEPEPEVADHLDVSCADVKIQTDQSLVSSLRLKMSPPPWTVSSPPILHHYQTGAPLSTIKQEPEDHFKQEPEDHMDLNQSSLWSRLKMNSARTVSIKQEPEVEIEIEDVQAEIEDSCQVMHDCTADNEDELDLRKGDIVTIISKETEADGWWEGEVNGRRGFFPSNFVTLIPRSGILQSATTSQPPVPGKRSVSERCQVTFDCAADRDDELQLRKGDIVTVISKETQEEGWWEGEVNGRRGFFPNNFVKLIPPRGAVQQVKKPLVHRTYSAKQKKNRKANLGSPGFPHRGNLQSGTTIQPPAQLKAEGCSESLPLQLLLDVVGAQGSTTQPPSKPLGSKRSAGPADPTQPPRAQDSEINLLKLLLARAKKVADDLAAQGQTLNDSLQAKISELNEGHRSKISELNESNPAKISELNDCHQAKISELNESHRAKISELNDFHQAKYKEVEDRLVEEMKMEVEEREVEPREVEDRLVEQMKMEVEEREVEPREVEEREVEPREVEERLVEQMKMEVEEREVEPREVEERRVESATPAATGEREKLLEQREVDQRARHFEQKELELKRSQMEQRRVQLEQRVRELEQNLRQSQLEQRERKFEQRETQLEQRRSELEEREGTVRRRETAVEKREGVFAALTAARAGQSLPLQLWDIELLEISQSRLENISFICSGRADRYGALLFRYATPEDKYISWCRRVNWSGSGRKSALPRNLKDFVLNSCKVKFPNMDKRDRKSIVYRINEALRKQRQWDNDPRQVTRN